MSRRLVGGSLAAVSLLAAATASSAAVRMPIAGCSTVSDISGDAKVNWNSAAASPVVNMPNATSNAGLDVLGVTFRLTSDQLQVFLAIQDIPAGTAMQNTETAFGYDVNFSNGTKNFRFQQLLANPTMPKNVRPDNAQTYPRMSAGDGAVLSTTIENVTGTVDPDTNLVTYFVPRAGIETFLGDKIPKGLKFTGIAVKTMQYLGNGTGLKPMTADTLDVTGDAASYTVGTDPCFAPLPTTLSALTAPAVQYGDSVKLSAKLVDNAGAALAGRRLEFSVGGGPAIAGTTGSTGVATVTYKAVKTAGNVPVVVRYAGDEDNAASTLNGTIVIKPEVTKFAPLAIAKPSATTRTVTATLLDDDKHAVAGVRLDWYVNGRKVASTTSDSRGRGVLKTAKPGQTVQARLAAVAGKYAAANSETKKV